MAVFFGSTANGHMQLWSAPRLRGRVMAIYTLLTLGTTVVGGPFSGWVCQHWSPRTGLGFAGFVTLAAAVLLALRRGPRDLDATPALTGAAQSDPLLQTVDVLD